MLETIIITLSTMCILLCYAARTRREILIFSGLCGALYISYWFFCGEMTACAISVLSVLGCAVQFLTPEKHLQRTVMMRTAFTIALAILACAISLQSYNDILPVLAFTLARLAETLTKPANIRTGYLASGSVWMSFALVTSNPAAIVSNIVCLSVQSYIFYRDFIASRKALQTA